ncbi:MAG: helix-turn-helix domain-containing protein [Oscillospiraceae bacterium]
MGNCEKLKPTGEMIKARRMELGMSQPQFAQKLGKSLSSVKKYEYGTMDIPFSVLVEICKVLDMEVMFLRGRD